MIDLFGRKPVFLFSIAVFPLGSMLCGHRRAVVPRHAHLQRRCAALVPSIKCGAQFLIDVRGVA
jgi:hypothetical protein